MEVKYRKDGQTGHPEEAVHMGQWNRKRMKKFSMEKVDNKMRKIYAELERES